MIDLSTLTGSAGAVAASALLIAGAAYVAGPTVGQRLITNGGEIERCETTLRSKTYAAVNEAIANVPKPKDTPDVGKTLRNTLGAVFGSLENGGKYMDMYGDGIEAMGAALGAPVREQYDAVKREYDETVARVRRAGELQAQSSKGTCYCLALATIHSDKGRSSLAWYVGTLGFVAEGPVADWQAAFHKPENLSACRGVS